MNCEEMMHIPELRKVLKLRAGKNGLERQVRWIYFADCLQCIRSEYKIDDYIHGGEFVILTNRSMTDDSRKLIGLIGQMYDNGISALGINEGQISEELLQYCEDKKLALFELPEKYPLIDLSQIMCRRLVLEENERNAGEQLFSSILDAEHLSREQVMAQARYLGISLEGEFCVAEFSFDTAKECAYNGNPASPGQKIQRIIHAECMVCIRQKILVLPQAGSVLALVPTAQISEEQLRACFLRIVDRAQRECTVHLLVGVGESKRYLDEIKVSRDEASTAIRTGAGRKEQVFFYREQGIYILLSQIKDSRILDTYVENQLGKLLRADEINGGNLCQTLENYLECSCNAKKTAEVLFVHRNTLNYRLKKISELLECDLENLDKCLTLKLAFLIRRYRKQ